MGKGKGSYRGLQASGQREVDSAFALVGRRVVCPACGHAHVLGDDGPRVVYEVDARLEAAALKLVNAVYPRVDPNLFELWLAPLALIEATSGHLVFGGHKHLTKWAPDRLGPLMRGAASQLAGRPMSVEFVHARLSGDVRTLGDLLTDGVSGGQIQ